MTEEEARELFDAFINWKSDGLTTLFTIEGHAEMLLTGRLGKLTEEQRRLLEGMHSASKRAIAHWDQFSSFIRFRYGFFDMTTWTALSVAELLASIHPFILFEQALDELPEELPLVYGARAYLSAALEYLLNPASYDSYQQDASVTAVDVSPVDPSMVAIQIDTTIQLGPEKIARPFPLFYPGTPPVTAALIIHQHGGQVEKYPLNPGTRFVITLPAWHSSSPPKPQ